MIQGGTVQVLAGSSPPTPALRYTLLTATSGTTGTLTSLQTTSNLAVLTPSLSDEAHGIAFGFSKTVPLTSATVMPSVRWPSTKPSAAGLEPNLPSGCHDP